MAAAALVFTACATSDASGSTERAELDAARPPTTLPGSPTSTAPAAETTTPPTTTSSTTTSSTTTTTTRPAVPRVVVETGFSPMSVAGPVTLLHPAAGVERVGFHESGHDGAQQQTVLETTARPLVMETRDRGTGDRTAADIVVVPDTEIRAPVTGTVIRAGHYTLYCDHTDEYAVIEPDARPGWEVKVLHVVGLTVASGDRVEAGVTVLAASARQLPFESQVDEHTSSPAWGHVHIEVVDPSIPDRPTPGGGCS